MDKKKLLEQINKNNRAVIEAMKAQAVKSEMDPRLREAILKLKK